MQVLVDLGAIVAQCTGTVAWLLLPLLGGNGPNLSLWCVPVAVFCTSCGWWENYVNKQSHIGKDLHLGETSTWGKRDARPVFEPATLPAGIIKSMGRVKERMKRTRYFTYLFVSVWKMVVFFVMMLVVTFFNGQNVANLFSMLPGAFSERKIVVTEVPLENYFRLIKN